MESFDSYYVLVKLRIGSELKNCEKMFNICYENWFEEMVFGELGVKMIKNSLVY